MSQELREAQEAETGAHSWQRRKRRHQAYLRSFLGNAELIQEARDWIEDCGGDTTDRSDWQVLEAIDVNYVGGLGIFLSDGTRRGESEDNPGPRRDYKRLQKVTVCESREGWTCSSPNGRIVVMKALEEYANMVDRLRPDVDEPEEEIHIKKIRIASARRCIPAGYQDEPTEFPVNAAAVAAIESARDYAARRYYAGVGA